MDDRSVIRDLIVSALRSGHNDHDKVAEEISKAIINFVNKQISIHGPLTKPRIVGPETDTGYNKWVLCSDCDEHIEYLEKHVKNNRISCPVCSVRIRVD